MKQQTQKGQSIIELSLIILFFMTAILSFNKIFNTALKKQSSYEIFTKEADNEIQ